MPFVSRSSFSWLFKSPTYLEDFADRTNHFWTFGLLLVLACIVSWKHGYNQPISCFTPTEFTATQAQYAHDVCWNSHIIQYPKAYGEAYDYDKSKEEKGTPVPIDYPVVMEKRASMSEHFPYNETATRPVYQWLPLIMCLQALFFKLPYMLMYVMHTISGLSFEQINSFTRGFESLSLRDRDDLCRRVANFIYDGCEHLDCPLPWRGLTIVWLSIKFLFCINVILQLVFIDMFLRTTNVYNGYETFYSNIITGNVFKNNATIWKESSAFPRIVYCIYTINQLRNIQTYHLQCHLPANVFNECVCVFVWVWLHFVAVVTIVSLLVWLIQVLLPSFRNRYIKTALLRSENIKESDFKFYEIKPFCDVIGEDGVMVLKLISANSSESLISEIVGGIWNLRKKRYEEYLEKGTAMLAKRYEIKQRMHQERLRNLIPKQTETETDI